MIILGCDPGANTGLVVVSTPKLGAPFHLCGATTVKRPGESKKARDEVERDVRFCDLLALAAGNLVPHGADVALIENPDVSAAWNKRSRFTDHRLGVYCGLALGVLRPRASSIVRVPVRGTRKLPGWCSSMKVYKPLLAKAHWLLRRHLEREPTEHEQSALAMTMWWLRSFDGN